MVNKRKNGIDALEEKLPFQGQNCVVPNKICVLLNKTCRVVFVEVLLSSPF